MHPYIKYKHTNIHTCSSNFIPDDGMEMKEAEQLKLFKKAIGKMATAL